MITGWVEGPLGVFWTRALPYANCIYIICLQFTLYTWIDVVCFWLKSHSPRYFNLYRLCVQKTLQIPHINPKYYPLKKNVGPVYHVDGDDIKNSLNPTRGCYNVSMQRTSGK